MKEFRKTRIAPTPSGFLHLGNAFSFIFTAAVARRHKASILLRIDDLDQARLRTEYLDDIFDTLQFLNIPWDEGPRNTQEVLEEYSQRYRNEEYRHFIEKLEEKGLLFPCRCSRKELADAGLVSGCVNNCKSKPKSLPYALKLSTHPDEVSVLTFPSTRCITAFPPEMAYLVVQKKDNFPSYHLASVVDDIRHGIDLIVRGKDLWHSTLAQAGLGGLLPEWTPFWKITFFHHELVTHDGKKLSKSAGSASVSELRRGGISKSSIYQQASLFFGLPQVAYTLDEFSALLPYPQH